MAQVKGRIFAYHNPDTNKLDIITDNRGTSPGLLTHNIFPDEQSAKTSKVHDDHLNYGHGNPIPDGTDAKPGTVVQSFPIGGKYNGHTIEAGAWHRVGVRNLAWQVFQIPQPGEVVEIPFEKMNASARGRSSTGWNPAPAGDNMDVGAKGPLAKVFAVLNSGPIRMVQGQADIEPVAHEDDPSRLKGWKVWLHNQATAPATRGRTTGFVGTMVLTNEAGEGTKNAGLGLESMVCPDKGYSVMQFVEHNGDYGVKQHGVRALPGTPVRLGIRGHSTFDTKLPSLEEGKVSIALSDFEKTEGESNSDWFDTKQLMPKMGEKKGLVDIYKDNRRINDEIPDTIYEGQEAFDRAEFKDPPQVKVTYVEGDEHLPNGGWKVLVKSELPDEDDLGPVGFRGQLKVLEGDRAYGDPAVMPAREFSPSEREATWYIPKDAKAAGFELAPGRELRFDSGALGWRGTVRLPDQGEKVDTHEDLEKSWVLCESDYKRARLYPPPRLSGAEAKKAGAPPPPALDVKAVPDAEDTPGGGWMVSLKSGLPESDDQGPLGMIATLGLGATGRDRAALPPKKFAGPKAKNAWFVPKSLQVGSARAEPGTSLTVDTGPLGWRATIDLPAEDRVEAKANSPLWAWQEDRYVRDELDLAKVEALPIRSDA